jgi:hypothetical protein
MKKDNSGKLALQTLVRLACIDFSSANVLAYNKKERHNIVAWIHNSKNKLLVDAFKMLQTHSLCCGGGECE